PLRVRPPKASSTRPIEGGRRRRSHGPNGPSRLLATARRSGRHASAADVLGPDWLRRGEGAQRSSEPRASSRGREAGGKKDPQVALGEPATRTAWRSRSNARVVASKGGGGREARMELQPPADLGSYNEKRSTLLRGDSTRSRRPGTLQRCKTSSREQF